MDVIIFEKFQGKVMVRLVEHTVEDECNQKP